MCLIIKAILKGAELSGIKCIHSLTYQQSLGRHHFAKLKLSTHETAPPPSLPPASGNGPSAVCLHEFNCFRYIFRYSSFHLKTVN